MTRSILKNLIETYLKNVLIKTNLLKKVVQKY